MGMEWWDAVRSMEWVVRVSLQAIEVIGRLSVATRRGVEGVQSRWQATADYWVLGTGNAIGTHSTQYPVPGINTNLR